MAKLFISYRRADSQHAVDRLYEGLRKHLKKSDIFIDVDNIPKGVDFVEHLSKQVAQCETLLVVVGPQWLTIKDEDGRRRLDDPQDFVRIEIEAALKRDIPVIPILLDNTPMPKAADLPPALQGFERRNAALLRRDAFRADLGELIEDLGLKRSGGAGRIAAAALLLAAIGAGGAAWMLDPLGWRAPTLAPDAGEEAIAATEIPPQQAAEAFADLIDPDTPGAAPDFSAIPEQIATKEPQTTETPPEDPAIRNAAIRRVQAALKRMGLYDGALDGDAGPGTRNAAAAYAEPKFLDPPDLSTAALDDITRFAERAGEDADAFEADERNAWAEVGGSGSIVLLEGFLRDYPKGVNAEKARGQIASLNAEAAAAAQRAQAAREAEAQAWALAQRTDT
ncbi:MAG: TIR domain-containing protein, partial [Pseudomonadota bacterium]